MQEYCPVFSFRNWKSKKYVGNDVTFYHLNWGLMGREIPLESSSWKDHAELIPVYLEARCQPHRLSGAGVPDTYTSVGYVQYQGSAKASRADSGHVQDFP